MVVQRCRKALLKSIVCVLVATLLLGTILLGIGFSLHLSEYYKYYEAPFEYDAEAIYIETATYTPANIQDSTQEYLYLFDDLGVPFVAGVPLFAPSGHSAWALKNTILTIIAIALAGLVAVRTLRFKKRPALDDGIYINNDEFTKRHLNCLMATGIAAILGIILLIITQDMRNTMVLVNFWTIIHAIFIAVEIFALVRIVKRSNAEENVDNNIAVSSHA